MAYARNVILVRESPALVKRADYCLLSVVNHETGQASFLGSGTMLNQMVCQSLSPLLSVDRTTIPFLVLPKCYRLPQK